MSETFIKQGPTTARHSFYIPLWESFRHAVINGCEYWELGFGEHRFDGEQLIRECFVLGMGVDETCDEWNYSMCEEMEKEL